MDEYFICETCNHRHHINRLKKRHTMPGDYCPTCAQYEQCAACGETTDTNNITYKHDIKNYICTSCLSNYQQVAAYIKPLTLYYPAGVANIITVRKAA